VDAPTRRHVLFLNWRDTTHPEGGGSEVYLERIAAELAKQGYRPTLFCAAHGNAAPRETTQSGLTVIRRGGRHTVYLWAACIYVLGWFGRGPLSRRQLGRPDVLVDVCNGLPFLAPLYSRRPVLALVHHVHREQWPVVLPPVRARLGWWIESTLAIRVYRHCRYITVSSATKAELIQLGVDRARITVIHNGTPDVPDTPVPRTTNPSLVVLCRLVPHKQVEIALRTVADLSDEFPTLELVVAGQGWWEPQLREVTGELGLQDRVHFTGFVDEDEKSRLLGSAWIALTPSIKEGWGLTIVEAGRVGTPTVAFKNAGGVAEAVVHGETGLLAEDADDFTAAVLALLTDDVQRKAMGEAARAHAARFTWVEAGNRFAALM
jgi:glycosyltransferase involved in cell wall biosynthesis